jgi:hypothetical protein
MAIVRQYDDTINWYKNMWGTVAANSKSGIPAGTPGSPGGIPGNGGLIGPIGSSSPVNPFDANGSGVTVSPRTGASNSISQASQSFDPTTFKPANAVQAESFKAAQQAINNVWSRFKAAYRIR